MNPLLLKLPSNRRTGSKPRCHWLTHGAPDQVAGRLTGLIEPWGSVSEKDCWMPEGYCRTDEPELHDETSILPDSEDYLCIRNWWFKKFTGGFQTSPSFDIASTCTIGNNKGILLVEAKAHTKELRKEEKGKPIKANPTDGERQNHDHIGQAIAWANGPLSDTTPFKWMLSRDHHYQMSNRFACACKLTEMGYPVIIIYLGFLNAEEMRRGKTDTPFQSHSEWESEVKNHSQPLFSGEIWEQCWKVHGKPLIPLIRSLEVGYEDPIPDDAR